ncbi:MULTISPECIES: NAD(P)-dependent oxidoreductase [unclassified Roseibium]|uniref:NAD(P)-dependent oxidoreductase n=1 Tax=unclassified Roseibium TaxID=2629323 RepID=UPI0027402054|nr:MULTISPECIES: NAD(P)-binding oxidoreductase [unclassified Roseibium]
MANILVIGASRGIGKAVCLAVAEKGHAVRAMSRSGTTPIGNTGAIEAIQGNALDRGDIDRALGGIDTVVLTLGVPASLDMITGPVTLFSKATQVLLPAMVNANINRLIAVTGFGAGDSRSAINPLQRLPFKALLGRAYADKTTQEAMISESGLDYLIVRPGVLTNQPKSGRYKVLEDPKKWRNGIIARADVADFIASRLSDEPLGCKKPVLIRWPL